MLASSTVTDPLGGSETVSQSIAAGGATGQRTVRRSAFEHRVNWGSVVDVDTQGPNLVTEGVLGPDYIQAPDGPVTLAHTFTMQRACNIVGVKIYKSPLLAGDIPVALWDDDGTLLTTETVTWVADGGGWREIEFSSPVAVALNSEYTLGYHVPGNDYAYSQFVFQGQDYIAYPFRFKTYLLTGAGAASQGSGRITGATITFPGTLSPNRQPANYYIDPIAEWADPLPGYTGGLSYYNQWELAGSRFNFPLAVFFADPENLEAYAAIGVNTLMAGPGESDYIDAVIAADMDWYPTLYNGDVTPVVAVQEDSVLAPHVRGYLITDEPDLIQPYHDPATVKGWRNAARLIDSTRPTFLNMSFLSIKNQGFNFMPVGASPLVANANWRTYAALPDILSCDFYSLAGTDSFNPSPAELNLESTGRYGIWAYPNQIRRIREMNDGRTPIWGVVETTSLVPGLPLPGDVKKAIWSQLIAGARGITLFDHRFATAVVTQDFAAMLSDPPMSTMIEALSARLQSLGDVLMAPEANLVSSVESSNTTEGPIGGTYGVPIHYTSRVVDDANYLFTQAIRPGATIGTFTVPDAADTTIDVIDESRTIDADGDGVFTDTFVADYTVHLYQWGDIGAGGISYEDSGSGTGIVSGTGVDEYIEPTAVYDDSGSGTITASGSGTDEYIPPAAEAMAFGGTPDGLSHADTALLNPTAEVTVEAWVEPGYVGDVDFDVVRKAGSYGIKMIPAGNFRGEIVVPAVPATYQITSTTVAVVGTTYHVALTWDGDDVRIYVDGVEDATAVPTGVGTIADTGSDFGIGTGADVPWVGVIDEAALYPTALSGARIAAHYDVGTGGGGSYSAEVLADDPNGYWELIDFTDSSGNGLTLTEAGTVTSTASLIIEGAGGGGELTLPLVDWEGGPEYYTVAQSGEQMTKAEAAGWSDPSFFPIAVWLSDPAHAADIAATGVNTYLGIFSDAGAIEDAVAEGMFVIPQANEWSSAAVAAETGNANVVGWLPIDEPELNSTPSAYASACTAIRAYDDGRFLLTNFCHGIRRTVFWGDSIGGGLLEIHAAVAENDVACVDQYCYTSPGIRGDDGPQGICDNFNFPTMHGGTSYLWPGDYQDGAAVEQAAAYGWQAKALKSLYTDQTLQRPVWIAVETQMPYLTDTGRDVILHAEIRGAVYSSIINEARGILYFQHNGFYEADELGAGNPEEDYTANGGLDPNTGAAPITNTMSLVDGPAGMISYVTNLNAEILSLAPVLNTQSYEWDFEATGIETMLKAYEGFAYIFAGKSVLGTTGSKTFTLPPEVTGTSLEVIGESRSVTASGGDFTDTFANEYTIHIYKVAI